MQGKYIVRKSQGVYVVGYRDNDRVWHSCEEFSTRLEAQAFAAWMNGK